jgi:hypothetical protein
MLVYLSDCEKVSRYRIKCPNCNVGEFSLRRDFRTTRLLNWQNCPSCKEKIIFRDIQELRYEEKEERRRGVRPRKPSG